MRPRSSYSLRGSSFSTADWRGYLVSLFALVWVSNMYMAAFAHLHLDIRHERLEIKSKDLDLKSKAEDLHPDRAA